MKKRLLAIALTAFMLFGTACQSAPVASETPTEEPTTSEATPASESTEDAAEEVGSWEPTKPIQFIVPYEAGGNSDIPSRIIAQYMSKYSAQPIEVINITGSGGRTGITQGMESEPDGHTVMLHSSGFIMQHALGLADFTYEDAAPIGYYLDSTMAVVVSANSPYETMDDLVAAAEAAPGEIRMGSVTGTLPLFGVLQIETEKGVEFNKVDLAGGSKAPELLGGRIDSYIDGFGSLRQYIDSGDFRCLAIIGSEPIVGYEDIPTFADLGFENYDYLKQDFGMWAPSGTPAEAIAYINNLIAQAAADPECIAELEKISFAPKHTETDVYIEALAANYAAFGEAAQMIVAE